MAMDGHGMNPSYSAELIPKLNAQHVLTEGYKMLLADLLTATVAMLVFIASDFRNLSTKTVRFH